MAYATRHPTHPDKLIPISTEVAGGTHKERRVAMFEKLGGPEVGAMARSRMFEGHRDKAPLRKCPRSCECRISRHSKECVTGKHVGTIDLPMQCLAVIKGREAFTLVPWRRELLKMHGKEMDISVRDRTITLALARGRVRDLPLRPRPNLTPCPPPTTC